MEKKWWLLAIMVIAVIGIAILVIYLIKLNALPKEIEPYYSDDPETWVEDKGKGIKEINVDKVTKGEGYIDANGQQYETAEIGTVFDYEGWYKGGYFRRTFETYDGKVIMRINPEMKPNDGVIEGFLVEKIEDNGPVTYIFLDNDWKGIVNNTKIYWGKFYDNNRDFDFSNEISEGVYMDKISDDADRFQDTYSIHSSGIYVGDLREDEYSTIISFY